jgi:methionyl-tRNA formyltransferase
MKLVMMGTGSFAEPTFQALLESSHQVLALVTQPDRVVGQERGTSRLAHHGMKELAQRHNLPVFQPDSINTSAGVSRLREFSPDLLVVAAYGQILSKDVLATARLGGINVHASLLPKYRGAAPIAWAIYNGETQSGVTIIHMSAALDAGDMVAQESVSIDPDETAGELEARLAPLGARMAVDVVARMATGPVVGTKQDKVLVTKAPKLTKEHGLIDWNRPAAAVCNQIRAMQPWPTAYTFLLQRGRAAVRLLVARARVSDQASNSEPGQAIIRPENALRVVVATAGRTAVEVLELQPAGKRRMAAAEFLRGRTLQAEDRFGPEIISMESLQ